MPVILLLWLLLLACLVVAADRLAWARAALLSLLLLPTRGGIYPSKKRDHRWPLPPTVGYVRSRAQGRWTCSATP